MPSRILDDEKEANYDLQNSQHSQRVRSESIGCLKRFFSKKDYWAGGSIPSSKVLREEHVEVVMGMTIMDSLALAYYCLEKNPPDTVNVGKKGWQIELCYECLKECQMKKFDIPKCHAGGILLVYLSLCHNVNFIPVLKKLSEIRAIVERVEREAEGRILAND